MAAVTRSGARKASEIVIFTLRTLHLSRLAMLSVVAVSSAISSSSHRRPRAGAVRFLSLMECRRNMTHVARVEVQPEQLIIQLDGETVGGIPFTRGPLAHGSCIRNLAGFYVHVQI